MDVGFGVGGTRTFVLPLGPTDGMNGVVQELTFAAFGAQYKGQKIDGRQYWGFAHSLDTGKYYPACVVFEQNHATVNLESGKRLDLTLDDETIEDPEEVVATDPRGQWWALSIDGLDERPNGSKTLILAGAAAQQDSG